MPFVWHVNVFIATHSLVFSFAVHSACSLGKLHMGAFEYCDDFSFIGHIMAIGYEKTQQTTLF